MWCFHLLHQGFMNVLMCVFVCAKCSCSCPYAVSPKTSVTSGINLNFMLKSNLTKPRIQQTSVITGSFWPPLEIHYNRG
jgi:hypothetical protein